MSADSPRRSIRGVPAVVPPQVVNDRSIIDSVAGFINDVTLTNQSQGDPKDIITWARFETTADISDSTFRDDWEIDGNATPPLLLILGYGSGIQVWAIPANGEAIEVLSWRHGNVTALRILPTPFSADDGMADEPNDNFADKRPLMAICDGVSTQTGLLGQQQPPHCSVNFISLKSGQQIKTIKFKNNVLDILANRTSVVITFPERIAVFDARTFEDRLSVTSCYPSPGINPNPIALGSRWLAFSESKLLHTKRSGGGCHGDGVSSYTATVLNAAKSFGKGLRELGEQMAAGLTGTTSSSGISSKSGSIDPITGDIKQPGVITILDIKHAIKNVSPTSGTPITVTGSDPIIAHFIAHSDAIVAMEFDYSGMLILTADKRGHDFHLFRIQPHPAGSHLAAVHHLYILHRGDTSAKVQNISFSMDSRWVAVSTLRGTTHVFPITPYGGTYGVRTHASLHVVNKLSRFHRSAGLSADNRSSSPISHSDSMSFNQFCMPYNNPTMPPFPRPHIILPLAQLRQPTVLGSPPGSAHNLSYQKSSMSSAASVAGRQRLSSLSDDNGKPLSVCAIFAKARSWLLVPPNIARDGPAHKMQRKAVNSLFIMAGHGALIQYDLDTKLASNVAREKICDDTPIELEVEAKAQWNLRRNECSVEIQPPLSPDNLLIKENYSNELTNHHSLEENDDRNDRWLSQVEIITHAGPHRRLWMGPQFVFKTYNTPSGSNLSHIDAEAIEIGITSGNSTSGTNLVKPGRSSPMNMPLTNAGRSPVPVLIESGSYSSIEQSPKLMDRFKHDHLDSDFTMTHGESRLKEDLADAMRESPSSIQHKDTGINPTTINKSRQYTITTTKLNKSSISGGIKFDSQSTPISPLVYNDHSSEQYLSAYAHPEPSPLTASEHESSTERSIMLIEKVVNPLGIVTTITRSPSENDFELNNPYGVDYDPDDYIIHENCDEALFRPVVTIFCNDPKFDDLGRIYDGSQVNSAATKIDEQPPELISTNLIVPVIEKSKSKLKEEKKLENVSKNDPKVSVEMIKKSNNLNKKLNNPEQMKGTREISSLENLNYSEKTAGISENISDNKMTEIDDFGKKVKSTKSGSRKNENSDIKAANKEETKSSNSGNKNDVRSIKGERENSGSISPYFKGKKSEEKDVNLSGNSNRKSEEKLRNDKMEIKSVEKTIKYDNSTVIKSSELVSTNTKEPDVIEQKQNKDDDSESFESLENIEINMDFASGISPTKYVGTPEEFEIIDKKISPVKKQIDNMQHKRTDEIKIISQSEDIKSNSRKEPQSNPESVNANIEINLAKKANKYGKQNTAMAESDLVVEEISHLAELQFYDKFVKDEIMDMTTTIKKNSTELEVDFPSLGESRFNKAGKKPKFEVSSKIYSAQPILPLTTSKIETAEEQHSKRIQKNNKKTDENISPAENVDTTVTFTLPMKKKSNKRLPTKEFTAPVQAEGLRNITGSTKVGESGNISIIKKNAMLKTKDLLHKMDLKTIQTTSDTGDGNIDIDEFSLPPLSPLQPFEPKFEESFELRDDKNSEEHFSLINFESPIQEKNKNSRSVPQINRKLSNESLKDMKITSDNDYDNISHLTKGLPENNIIFALCGSLHYENENSKLLASNDSEIQESKELKNLVSDEQHDQYTSLEQIKGHHRPKIHQQRRHSRDGKLKITTNTTPSTPSSSDTDESSGTISFKLIKNHQDKNINKLMNVTGNNDDIYDEELRPLISTCSLVSSVTGGTSVSATNKKSNKTKNKKCSNDELSPTFTIASEITHTQIENSTSTTTKNLTLPHHLNVKNSTKTQSSDSSSDQANNTSEEQGADSDEQQQIISTNLKTTTDDTGYNVAAAVTDQTHNDITGREIISSGGGGTVLTGSSGNISNTNQQQQNLKKKPKRKKR